MRIAWFSNAPWQAGGYGGQTKLFVPRLRAAGHELAILANFGLQGGILSFRGIPVYPQGYDVHSNDVIAAHSKHWRADVTISLYDIWALEPAMFQEVRWAPWFPVDQEPIAAVVAEKARQAWFPMTFSRFGQAQAAAAGIETTYIPHGIDTGVFYLDDQQAARERLGWPADRFIVGMVGKNKGGSPSRKAFPEALRAFAEFHRQHPDSLLYLHTSDGRHSAEAAVDLPELAESLGIAGTIIWASQYGQVIGEPEVVMRDIYNAMDVLLSPSMGEGFGIPIVEAQACGTPVIVGDWTAMGELCFAGWKIDRADAALFLTPMGSYAFLPKVGAIVEALNTAFAALGHKDVRLRKARQAVDGAAAYDADLIVRDYWLPALVEMERRVRLNEAVLAGAR